MDGILERFCKKAEGKYIAEDNSETCYLPYKVQGQLYVDRYGDGNTCMTLGFDGKQIQVCSENMEIIEIGRRYDKAMQLPPLLKIITNVNGRVSVSYDPVIETIKVTKLNDGLIRVTID